MRDVELEKCGVCCACGSRVRGVYVYAAPGARARGRAFLEALTGERGLGAPRVRSGLAYASGYAALAYLFGYSLAPLLFGAFGLSGTAATLLLLWGLWGPLAVALAFAAAVSLDRSRAKSGRLPALFGLVVGLNGTYHTAFAAYGLLRYFNAL